MKKTLHFRNWEFASPCQVFDWTISCKIFAVQLLQFLFLRFWKEPSFISLLLWQFRCAKPSWVYCQQHQVKKRKRNNWNLRVFTFQCLSNVCQRNSSIPSVQDLKVRGRRFYASWPWNLNNVRISFSKKVFIDIFLHRFNLVRGFFFALISG